MFDNTQAHAEGWELKMEIRSAEPHFTLRVVNNAFPSKRDLWQHIYQKAEVDKNPYHRAVLTLLLKVSPEQYENVMFGRL